MRRVQRACRGGHALGEAALHVGLVRLDEGLQQGHRQALPAAAAARRRRRAHDRAQLPEQADRDVVSA